jgi:hypothetical protein
VGVLPLVGDRAAAAWNDLAARDFPEVLGRVEPYSRDVTRWLLAFAPR